MKIRKNTLWITQTAVLIALLVTMQIATAPLGNQLLTGSVGNMIMIISFLVCGPATGFTVAVISPVCASLVGFGPAFPPLVPFIALGNAALIGAWFLFGWLNKFEKPARRKAAGYLTVIAAAVIKFFVLYAGVVKIAVPYILNLNETQSAMISLTFSYPQIITAVTGGVAALSAVPLIKKALKR